MYGVTPGGVALLEAVKPVSHGSCHGDEGHEVANVLMLYAAVLAWFYCFFAVGYGHRSLCSRLGIKSSKTSCFVVSLFRVTTIFFPFTPFSLWNGRK